LRLSDIALEVGFSDISHLQVPDHGWIPIRIAAEALVDLFEPLS
jgi:hypothetical protein